jgi:hypothetical protein
LITKRGEASEFEEVLETLEALSRREITELVAVCFSPEEAARLTVVTESVGIDVARLVCARALLRLQRARSDVS